MERFVYSVFYVSYFGNIMDDSVILIFVHLNSNRWVGTGGFLVKEQGDLRRLSFC